MRNVARHKGLRVCPELEKNNEILRCSREQFLKHLSYIRRVLIPQKVEEFLKDATRPRWIPQRWWPHAGIDYYPFYCSGLVNLEGLAYIGEDVNYVVQGMLAVLLDTPGLGLVVGRKAAVLEIPPKRPTVEFYRLGVEYAREDWKSFNARLDRLFGSN